MPRAPSGPPNSSTGGGGSRTAERCSRPSPATAGRSRGPCRPGASTSTSLISGCERSSSTCSRSCGSSPCGSRGSRDPREEAPAPRRPPCPGGAHRRRRVRGPRRHTSDVRYGDRDARDVRRLVLPARRRTGGLGGPAAGREPGGAERHDPWPDPERRQGRRAGVVRGAGRRLRADPGRVAGPRALLDGRVVRPVGGGRGARAPRRGGGGGAAEPCAPAAGGRWFLPDGTTDVKGDHDYVVVMNPFAREAVFSITLLSERREPGQQGSLTDVALRPFRSVAFDVGDVLLGEPTVSALVDVSVGRVAAATLGVSGTGGIRSALGYLGPPPGTLTFPGGADAGQTRLVVVRAGDLNDGERVALEGDLLVEDGPPQVFGGLADASMPPSSGRTFPTTTTGPTSVRFTASGQDVAAVRRTF